MKVRRLKSTEKSIIDDWSRVYWKAPHAMPWDMFDYPVVVEEHGEILAFTQVLEGRSRQRLISFTMGSPIVDQLKRYEALAFLLSTLENRFKAEGGKYLFTVSESPQLTQALKEKFNFQQLDSGTLLVREIGGNE